MTEDESPATAGGVHLGDPISILLVTDRWIYGELVYMYAGEGQTDGLLHVRQDGDDFITNVYERHIVLLHKREAI